MFKLQQGQLSFNKSNDETQQLVTGNVHTYFLHVSSAWRSTKLRISSSDSRHDALHLKSHQRDGCNSTPALVLHGVTCLFPSQLVSFTTNEHAQLFILKVLLRIHVFLVLLLNSSLRQTWQPLFRFCVPNIVMFRLAETDRVIDSAKL